MKELQIASLKVVIGYHEMCGISTVSLFILEKDDICGLNYSKLSIYDKMKIIYEETCLKEQFSMAGLEVA